MEDNAALQQMVTQINQITQSLDGTIAQIESLNRKLEDNSKQLMENLAAVNENMRLIIEVIRKGRTNTKELLEEVEQGFKEEIQKLWKEKFVDELTDEEMEAIDQLKEINRNLSDNLYMQQMVAIITSLREITGKALAIKLQKK